MVNGGQVQIPRIGGTKGSFSKDIFQRIRPKNLCQMIGSMPRYTDFEGERAPINTRVFSQTLKKGRQNVSKTTSNLHEITTNAMLYVTDLANNLALTQF